MKHVIANQILPLAAIESGDLLAWAGNNKSTIKDFTIKAIRTVTREDFGHVGIAWRVHDGLDDELVVIEASMPEIKITRLTTDLEFFCVPAKVPWGTMNKAFLMNKLGLKYGTADAIRAGLGWRIEHDKKWQCAELAHGFYEVTGLKLPDEFRPGQVVGNLMAALNSPLYRVIGPGRALDFQ